jgi:ankyrin repeat protein
LQRQDSLNASFTYAASSGDPELVQTILAKRVSPDTADYDGRSAMHLASSEGMTECLKVILSSKGDANLKDRWGSTPLQDALNGGFLGTCKLLRSFGGDLGLEDPAGLLCSCASDGDTPRMQQLLDYRIDVNCGDYDLRTALHLASTEGRLTVVSFLVAHGADVNVKDRWNSTPLEDAIRNGFKTAAHHLRGYGGRVGAEFAANLLCDAASTGNLAQLQMLVQNGVDSNLFDYDMRTAVHLAAAEGQLLALNFLVNVANGNHSPLDRWKSTPLQDAIAVVTTCARIYSWLKVPS